MVLVRVASIGTVMMGKGIVIIQDDMLKKKTFSLCRKDYMVPGLSSWEESGMIHQHEEWRKRNRCGEGVTSFKVVVLLGLLRCAVHKAIPTITK